MPQQIMNIIWTAVGIIVTALVGWGVDRFIVFLNTKIKDKKLAAFLTKILSIVTGAVKQIYQEFVEVLKKEGKFDAEAQKQAKEKALKVINEQMTPELTEYIKSNFGDVQTYLNNKIEEVLYNLKNNK